MFRYLIILNVCYHFIYAQNFSSIHQEQLKYYNQNYNHSHKISETDTIYPISSRSREVSKEIFGYHPYWMGTAWTNYNFDLISTLAYFSVEASATGGLTNLHGWPVVDLINEAHSHGTKVVLCVTLFNTNDLITLLSNPEYRQNLIANLLYQVQAGNADGVNVDFESFPPSQKENMVTFISDLTQSFHQNIPGSEVTIAMPAVDWNNAWDYNALASISDGLFIMGYGYHWSGSSNSGPNSPLTGPGYTITWTVIDYLNKTNFQSEKLILGCPYYGIIWPTESNNAGALTRGNGESQFFSEMEGNALSFGKLWQQSSQTPWYNYNNSGWFQGWYDDSLSLSLKYDFSIFNNLKGIGIWALGYDGNDSKLWDLLHAKFGQGTAPTRPNRITVKNVGEGKIKVEFSGAETADEYIILRDFLEPIGARDTIGIFTENPILIEDLNLNETYFISIVAKNTFGSSESTELLGTVPSMNPINVLIVNGFDRVNGTNNSFDFIRQHGSSIKNQNYAFDSSTNEAVINGDISLLDYQFVDWILGEEGTATSSFANSEQNIIKNFLESGRFLFVSGSEIGYDLVDQGNQADNQFYSDYLKASYISDAAGGHQGTYQAYGVSNSIFNDIVNINFDDGTQGSYNVDWPDGIKPINGSRVSAKFNNVNYDSRGGMAVEYTGTFGSSENIGGVVYLSVGFESIFPESKRDEIISSVFSLYETQLNTNPKEPKNIPLIFSIHGIHPNPTNSSATLSFSSKFSNQKIKIFASDILGRRIVEVDQNTTGLLQTWTWDGKNKYGQEMPAGVYFLSIHSQSQTFSKKFTILK